jgi:hypothetical protein
VVGHFWYNREVQNSPDNFSRVQQSATLSEVADSRAGSRDSRLLNQTNSTGKENVFQKESQEKVQKEHQKFESDLKKDIGATDRELDAILDEDVYVDENNLKSFIDIHYSGDLNVLENAKKHLSIQKMLGMKVTTEKLKSFLSENIDEKQELSTEDQIKAYKEQLSTKGKSSVFILKSLIAKFGSDLEISAWTENWKEFLRLHELSKTRSPKEREAIQSIIARADYTSENAFSIALATIQSSTELSETTKREIVAEFDGSYVTTVVQMDSGLQLLKDRKKEASRLLGTKQAELDSLNSDIEELKQQLENLPEGNSKREKLEQQISKKTDLLKDTQDQVELLKTESRKQTAFEIRSGFFAELNPVGSRSLKIPEKFSLKLPSNTLPFTGLKNLRTVNLAFVCDALKRHGIMNEVFSPNLDSGTIPSKSHRDTGHLILESLGIADKQILSEKDIATVNRDLSRIMDSGVLSPREHLIQMGLYDLKEQYFDIRLFQNALLFARENRRMKQERFSKKLLELSQR